MDKSKHNCDITKARHVARCTWVCHECGRDLSLEYILLHEALDKEVKK